MKQGDIVKNFISEPSQVRTELLLEISSDIPGSVQYSIKRFARPKNWIADDVGVINYHYHPSQPSENRLELKFCSIGNMYCSRDAKECNQCKSNAYFNCEQKEESVDFLSFIFSSSLLEQFIGSRNTTNTLSEGIISFQQQSSFSKLFAIGHRTRMVLESLLNHNYSGNLANIFINAQTQMLLLYSLDSLQEKENDTSANKFLASEADREKILKAREVLLQHIGEPITIKTLSRKVAMNECYLKKGFKALVGKGIHEYQQELRISKAKDLLAKEGLSVSDVANTLGYSSISHFSTAFKKATGLKPCELLA